MPRRALLLALPLLPLLAGSAAAAGDARVAALQVALRAHHAYRGTIDGIDDRATERAVIRFQRRAGLVADGVAGPQTRRALGRLARHPLGSRTLRRGEAGEDVAALQFELAWHGFPSGALDGVFGLHTTGALRRFQRFAGLAVDGRAGPATLAALTGPPPRSPIPLALPLAAPLGDPFGPRGDRFHAGLDIPAPPGTPVHAAAPGRVVWSAPRNGWGLLVVLAHGDGVRTFYAHLLASTVRLGERVRAGVEIGRVGATGDATGPHLHFEVRVRGAAVDPLGATGT